MEVMQAAFAQCGHELVNSKTDDGALKMQWPEQQKAFLLLQDKHWLGVVKVGALFWDVNSKITRPTPMHDIKAYLEEKLEKGADVFIVDGAGNLTPLDKPLHPHWAAYAPEEKRVTHFGTNYSWPEGDNGTPYAHTLRPPVPTGHKKLLHK